MSVEQILDMWKSGGWVPFAALAVGLIVRVTKEDTKLPIDIPAKWRPMVAIVAGALLGAFEKVIAGGAWKDALLGGAAAAVLAIAGHYLGVDVARGGKDIPVPGMMKEEK